MIRTFTEENYLKAIFKLSGKTAGKVSTNSIAEEMQIKPGLLKKAIKMAQKRDFDKARDDLDMIESILNSTDKLQNADD